MYYSWAPNYYYNTVFAIFLCIAAILFLVRLLRFVIGGSGGEFNGSAGGKSRHGGRFRALSYILTGPNNYPAFIAPAVLCLLWGSLGYFVNALLMNAVMESLLTGYRGDLFGKMLQLKLIFMLINLFGSGFVSLLILRLVIGPILPRLWAEEKTSLSTDDFVGWKGQVSTILDPMHGGMILVDTGSGVVKLKGKLVMYEGPPLRRGEEILIVGSDDNEYRCVPWTVIEE